MTFAATLRKHGFRRWYERQLYESHAYLVTALLSLILLVTSVEISAGHETLAQKWPTLLLAAGAAILCVFAWREFSRLLCRAEAMAVQAVCSECRSYGKFDVVASSRSSQALAGEIVSVRCRKCCREWQLA
jgi:hypothetical protein